MSKKDILNRILDEQQSLDLGIRLTEEEAKKLDKMPLQEAIKYLKNKN